MKSEKDIFNSYGVPDGYFEGLKCRLGSISQEKVPSAGTVAWTHVQPYLSLAAGFAAVLVAGTAILKNTAMKHQSTDQLLNENSYADMIAVTHPESFMNVQEYEHESLSEEDIINYLIESGTEMEYLAYSGGQ